MRKTLPMLALVTLVWTHPVLAQPATIEKLVASDTRMQAILESGDARVLSTEELDTKDGTPARAQVVIESPRLKSAVRAIIDVSTGRVLESRSLTARELPLTQEQLAQATAIALRDPAVRRFLGETAERFRAAIPGTRPPFATEGFLVASEDPGDPCARSRCIDLLFIANGRYFAGQRVTVELDAGRVTVRPMGQHGEAHR